MNEGTCQLFLLNKFVLRGNELVLAYVSEPAHIRRGSEHRTGICVLGRTQSVLVGGCGDDRNTHSTRLLPPLTQLELLLRLHSGLFPRQRNIVVFQMFFKKIYAYLAIFTQCL